MVMMARRAMDMAMLDLVCGRRAHFGNSTGKHQGHAGQRMVAVDDHLVVRDVGDGVDQQLLGAIGLPLELHANRDVAGKFAAWLDMHQLGVVLAERVVRREPDAADVAHALAVERVLDQKEDTLVTAVQIFDRRVRPFDQIAIDVKQLIMQRHHPVPGYLHLAISFTRPSTSTAWPRGFTQ